MGCVVEDCYGIFFKIDNNNKKKEINVKKIAVGIGQESSTYLEYGYLQFNVINGPW